MVGKGSGKEGPVIYILTSGEYSDYGIRAVTRRKEVAEWYEEKVGWEIEEWEDDEVIIGEQVPKIKGVELIWNWVSGWGFKWDRLPKPTSVAMEPVGQLELAEGLREKIEGWKMLTEGDTEGETASD